MPPHQDKGDELRVAVTVWNDRISPVFDVSREIRIFEVREGRVTGEEREIYACDNAAHKIRRLRDLKVETLICGAISQSCEKRLAGEGVDIIAFAAGDLDRILRAYLAGKLPQPALSMPGCRCRRGRWKMKSARRS